MILIFCATVWCLAVFVWSLGIGEPIIKQAKTNKQRILQSKTNKVQYVCQRLRLQIKQCIFPQCNISKCPIEGTTAYQIYIGVYSWGSGKKRRKEKLHQTQHTAISLHTNSRSTGAISSSCLCKRSRGNEMGYNVYVFSLLPINGALIRRAI